MIITVTKGLAILMTVFEQSRADIFVMDWERFEYMKKVQVPIENSADGGVDQPKKNEEAK